MFAFFFSFASLQILLLFGFFENTCVGERGRLHALCPPVSPHFLFSHIPFLSISKLSNCVTAISFAICSSNAFRVLELQVFFFLGEGWGECVFSSISKKKMIVSALQLGGVLLKAEGGRRTGIRRGAGAGIGAAAAAGAA